MIEYYIKGNIVFCHIASKIGGEQSHWSRFEQAAGLED